MHAGRGWFLCRSPHLSQSCPSLQVLVMAQSLHPSGLGQIAAPQTQILHHGFSLISSYSFQHSCFIKFSSVAPFECAIHFLLETWLHRSHFSKARPLSLHVTRMTGSKSKSLLCVLGCGTYSKVIFFFRNLCPFLKFALGYDSSQASILLETQIGTRLWEGTKMEDIVLLHSLVASDP